MSNIDIVRNVTAELATRTKAQVTGWRWADGVVVFPDIRCPYCKTGVQSPAIWKHTDTKLIGQVVPQVGVTPVLEKPNHAHVVVGTNGGICLGRAKTAYQALFGALNGTANYKHMVAPFLDSPLMGNHHCEEMDAVAKRDTFECYGCEGDFDEDVAYHWGDEQYCADCFYEVAFYCAACGDIYSVDDRNIGGDDEYCDNCFSRKYFSCEKCGETSSKDGGCFDTPDGDCCEDCYHNNYFGCEDCGETTANKDRAAYDDEALCQDCFDANYTTCPDCVEVYKDDDGHDCTEAKADDWGEDTLNEADEVVRLLAEDDPDNKLLARVRARTFQRYLDA